MPCSITTVRPTRSFPTRRARSIAGSHATREWQTRITSSRRTGRGESGPPDHRAIGDDRRRFLSIAAVIAGAGPSPDRRKRPDAAVRPAETDRRDCLEALTEWDTIAPSTVLTR